MGGVYRNPAACFLPAPSRVLEGVSGGNGVRKLANCADWRGALSSAIWKDLRGPPAVTDRDLARDLVACSLQATPCRPPLG